MAWSVPRGWQSQDGNPVRLALKANAWGFSGRGPVVKSPSANAGHLGLIPAPGGSHMPRKGWTRAPQLLNLHA